MEQKTMGQDIKKKHESIYLVLLNSISFLHERSTLTLGEANHILRTIKGAKWTPSTNKKNNPKEESPFNSSCNTIKEGLQALIGKIKIHQEKIKEKKSDIKILLEQASLPQATSTEHMEAIILFDCFQQRSIFLAEKLAYFYRAYKNLVEKHGYIHIPLPDVSRRVKTSNLMLYFDHTLLKDGYKILRKEFFRLPDSEKAPSIISTWDFAASEHIKQLDNNNIYVSFSFWFFEKQYFYPIGYHELSHSLYQHPNNSLKPSPKEKMKIREFIGRKVFLFPEAKEEHEAFFSAIYQDTIADISAYSLAGESYIHALFYQGFLRDIHKNFYLDIEENSILDGVDIKDNDRDCTQRHEQLSILSWQNMSKDSISLFVRLKMLLKIHRIYQSSDEHDKELHGIELILDTIYPENISNKEYPRSFNDITQVNNIFHSEYRSERAKMLLVWALLRDIIFPDNTLKKEIKKRIDKTKSLNLSLFDNEPYASTLTGANGYLDLGTREQKIHTYFDFVWQLRFQILENNIPLHIESEKPIYSGRLWRAKNLYDLGVINENYFSKKDEGAWLESAIYELVLFKFKDIQTMPCPTQNLDLDQTSYFNNSEIKPVKISYACGPYNYAVMIKNSTNNIDKYLKDIDEKPSNAYSLYFTERHALFFVSGHKGEKSDGYVDFIIFITAENPFTKDTNSISKIVKNLRGASSRDNMKNKYSQMDIFSSMGNENLVLYISGTSPSEICALVDTVYESKEHISESYSMITFNKNFMESSSSFLKANMGSLDLDILLLCSAKKQADVNKVLSVKEIDSKITEALNGLGHTYRLFGVFDYKIRIKEDTEDVFNKIYSFIVAMKNDDIFDDVQIELQPKVQPKS